MVKRKFYRTTFTIDVLSEDIPFQDDVAGLAYAINDGDCVGGKVRTVAVELHTARGRGRALRVRLRSWVLLPGRRWNGHSLMATFGFTITGTIYGAPDIQQARNMLRIRLLRGRAAFGESTLIDNIENAEIVEVQV